MGIIARQSTARIVTVGPVLNADGVAVTDGVVGDFKISKNGGAPAALNVSATLTHRHTGHYSLSLTATDLDTVGSAEITIDDTVNSCGIKEVTVIEEVVYDALFAAAANTFMGAAGSSKVTGVVLTDTMTTYTGNTVQTGDAFARLGAPAGASVSADIADVPTVAEFNARTLVAAAYFDPATDVVASVTNLTNLPSIPANWITAAGIAADAITAAKIADGAIDAATFAAGAINAAAIATDAVNEIVDQVWDEILSGHAGVGSTGAALSAAGGSGDPWSTAVPGAYGAGTAGHTLGTYIDAAISSRMATYTQPTGFLAATFPVTVASTTNITAASGVTISGTTTTLDALQTAQNAAHGAGSWATATGFSTHSAADVWSAATRTLTAFGFTVTTANAADVTAILADTNELQLDWANNGRLDLILDARASQSSLDVVDGIVDDILVDTGTTIPAQITNLNDISIANVSTGVTTALTTALTEGYRATNSTGSVRDLLYEVLQSISEFTISGTTKTVKRLDGSTTAKTYTLNDGTTPTGITETT